MTLLDIADELDLDSESLQAKIEIVQEIDLQDTGYSKDDIVHMTAGEDHSDTSHFLEEEEWKELIKADNCPKDTQFHQDSKGIIWR